MKVLTENPIIRRKIVEEKKEFIKMSVKKRKLTTIFNEFSAKHAKTCFLWDGSDVILKVFVQKQSWISKLILFLE